MDIKFNEQIKGMKHSDLTKLMDQLSTHITAVQGILDKYGKYEVPEAFTNPLAYSSEEHVKFIQARPSENDDDYVTVDLAGYSMGTHDIEITVYAVIFGMMGFVKNQMECSQENLITFYRRVQEFFRTIYVNLKILDDALVNWEEMTSITNNISEAEINAKIDLIQKDNGSYGIKMDRAYIKCFVVLREYLKTLVIVYGEIFNLYYKSKNY